jgi:hypothetical protein
MAAGTAVKLKPGLAGAASATGCCWCFYFGLLVKLLQLTVLVTYIDAFFGTFFEDAAGSFAWSAGAFLITGCRAALLV